MNPKRIESILFFTFALLLIVALKNEELVKVILLFIFFALIGTWIWGLIAKKNIENFGFSKTDFIQRLLLVPFLFGIMRNVTLGKYSSMFIALGLLLIFLLLIIQAIQKLVKNNAQLGVELLIIAFVVLGFFLRIMFYPLSGEVRIISLTLLVSFYIVSGILFLVKSGEYKYRFTGIVGMLLFFCLSIHVLAILFDIMFWPGSMIYFAIAVLLSFIFYSIFYLKTFKRNLDSDFSKIIQELNNRAIIVFCVSVFIGVATPMQFIRLSFGNRPQIVEAYYNCKIKGLNEKYQIGNNCEMYELLNLLLKNGYYPDGISDQELENNIAEFKERE